MAGFRARRALWKCASLLALLFAALTTRRETSNRKRQEDSLSRAPCPRSGHFRCEIEGLRRAAPHNENYAALVVPAAEGWG